MTIDEIRDDFRRRFPLATVDIVNDLEYYLRKQEIYSGPTVTYLSCIVPWIKNGGSPNNELNIRDPNSISKALRRNNLTYIWCVCMHHVLMQKSIFD